MGSKSNRSRRHTEELKRDAVALVRSSGKNVTEVAREIGVSAERLRNWVKQDTIDRGQGAPGELTTAEREELRRLRRRHPRWGYLTPPETRQRLEQEHALVA
ncbi:transposase [Streptomyces albogriseolus]|uniref:transposase n=1 Tax=Streptomyces albogriseolus TaxID=1887 RepID=UPI003D709820